MEKTNKKKAFSRTLIFAIWLFSKSSRIFIFANMGKIPETREKNYTDFQNGILPDWNIFL